MRAYLQKGGRPITIKRILDKIHLGILDTLYPNNAFCGVYENFEQATNAAPKVKPTGYDSANSQEWYNNKLKDLLLEDYPVLFWLRTALQDSHSLFEIGGHVGEAFYAFSRVLSYPPDLQWTILDVPSINAWGRDLAEKRGKTNLHFVEHVNQVDGADIVFAAGSLQYIDQPSLPGMIAAFRHKPKHILINITPVYDGPSFVTVQNIGTVYCPYRVFNREELISALDKLGYALIDSWKKPRVFRIKWHPECYFENYSGFYFRMRSFPGR